MQKNNDLEGMVYRMQITNEIINALELAYNPSKRIGFSSNQGIYEMADINKTLNYILPDNAKVPVTIDDIRIKSDLNIFQFLKFFQKSFFSQS